MKKTLPFLFVSLLLLPSLTYAQTVQKLLENIPNFISDTVLPFLFGIAFLVFVYNVIRYFVIGADNEKDRDIAKDIAIYSVAAFAFLLIFWGIVNMIEDTIGITNNTAPCSDYIKVASSTACP